MYIEAGKLVLTLEELEHELAWAIRLGRETTPENVRGSVFNATPRGIAAAIARNYPQSASELNLTNRRN